MYKNLRTFHMLSFVRSVQIEFLNLETSVAALENGDPFLKNLVPSNENMFLLFMASNTTVVMATSSIFFICLIHIVVMKWV